MSLIGIGVQLVLGIFVLLGGFIKVLRIPFQVQHWQLYQYPMWTMSAVGIAEILLAAGLIGGLWYRQLSVSSAAVLAVIMLGAIYTHIIQANQPAFTAIPASICLLLAIYIIIRNWNNISVS